MPTAARRAADKAKAAKNAGAKPATQRGKASGTTAKGTGVKESTRQRQRAENADLVDLIKEDIEEGLKQAEIAAKHKISTGRASFLMQAASTKASEKWKWKTDSELQKLVKKARDTDHLSWAHIMIRGGISEGAARAAYRQAGGNDKGHRIGKGGRHPGDGTGTAKKQTTAAKRAPKREATEAGVKRTTARTRAPRKPAKK